MSDEWLDLEAKPEATVYLAGLDAAVTEDIIYDACLPFGEIVRVSLPRVRGGSGNGALPHRGFAFVEFEDAADALEAVANLHQAELLGATLCAKLAQTRAGATLLQGQRAVWAAE